MSDSSVAPARAARNRDHRDDRRTVNPVSLGFTAAGAVLAVVSFTLLDWFRGSVGRFGLGGSSSFRDVNDVVERLESARRALGDRDAFHLGLSEYYYSWLAWVLVGAAVVVAVVAAAPTAEGGQVRVLGVLMSALGIAATVWAMDVYRPAHDNPRVPQGPSFADFVGHASWGAWSAIAAFVLIGIGAGLGPRRAR